MFRLFLFIFFKLTNLYYENINENSLSKFISNEELRRDIILRKEFFYLWRKKLNNQIINEHDTIKKIKLKKNKNGITLKVKTIHSFKIKTSGKYKKCFETLHYVFLISNFKIVDMTSKEHNPDKYKKLLYSTSSSPVHSKYQCKWDELINNVDLISQNYINCITEKSNNIMHRSTNLYSRENSVSYAQKYALKYNPVYKDFNDNGGDCTNFISQCIHAGNIPLSKIWKPYTNPWIRVNELYYYLIRNNLAKNVPSLSSLSKGDIIQFFSNSKGFFAHSGIITDILDNGEILYSCHTFDKLDYPLSEIYPSLYTTLRFLKITY